MNTYGDCTFQHEHKNNHNHNISIVQATHCVSLDSINTLCECMSECAPRGSAQSLDTCSYMAFFGFGSVEMHTALVTVVQTTLVPGLIHSSFVKPGNFEGILALRACQSSEAVERLLDCFTMSIGVVDIESYMDTSMIACLQRIAQGVDTLGNMHLHASDTVRARLEAATRESNLVLEYAVPMALFSLSSAPVLNSYEVHSGDRFLHLGSILYTPTHMQTHTHFPVLEVSHTLTLTIPHTPTSTLTMTIPHTPTRIPPPTRTHTYISTHTHPLTPTATQISMQTQALAEAETQTQALAEAQTQTQTQAPASAPAPALPPADAARFQYNALTFTV